MLDFRDDYQFPIDGTFNPGSSYGGGGSPPVNPNDGAPGAPDGGAGGGGGGGNGGGGGGAWGSGLSLRPEFNFRPVPEFVPPQFRAPTFEEAQNEPGYQFRLEGGVDALERSAAASGRLRTGGTLTDVVEYGQNFASQEYRNVFDRAIQSFDREYRGAHDAFAPRLAEWTMLSQAEREAAMAAFQREWQVYLRNNPGGGGGGGGGFMPEPPPLNPIPGGVLVKPGNTEYDF